MSSIKTTQIDGDLSLGRNIAMGGKANVAGSMEVGHGLTVKGWLDAPNIKGSNKGVFASLSALQTAYPEPQDGWLAGIGDSTPFTAYTGQNGSWVATGGTIDINVDMTQYTEDLEAHGEQLTELEAHVEDLDDVTTLGEDTEGNAIRPSDIQAVMKTGEFVEVKTDKQGNVLWSIDKDGNLEMNLPMNFTSATHGVKDDRLENYYTMASKEWTQLVLDAEDNIVFGIKTNGEVIASTMDANLATATISAIEQGIKDEYDEAINTLKAEAADPLDKYVSLSSGISQADIANGTSKYHEIAKKSSNPNMSQKACAVLYNLMKLEKENRFLASFFSNIDNTSRYHKAASYTIGGVTYNSYKEQFRTESTSGGVTTYSPKEPNDPTFVFDPLTKHAYYKKNDTEYIYDAATKTPLIYMYDVRVTTDIKSFTAAQRAENKAILLTVIKKAWVDYKAIPVLCWHECNPYCPIQSGADPLDPNKPYSTLGKPAYNYTYDDDLYPQEHRYVIKEILEGTCKLPPDGVTPQYFPNDDYTQCGFDREVSGDNPSTFDCPADWFDARCQQVGQFIKDLYTFIGEEIPIIFRLWHECEDSWQWWGAAMCEVEDYKAFYRLTVDKIKEYSESNSLLFGYCTDHNFTTPLVKKFGEYDLRYPGDDYVDIVGFDDYEMGRPNYLLEGLSKMKTVSSFAKAHGKPTFIWETGNTKVDPDWFETWVSVFQTAGINFSALMGWGSSYPPYNIDNPTTEQKISQLEEQLADMAQYYNRSNMPCAEEGFDLTTITDPSVILASQVTLESGTGLLATNVQAAAKELNDKIPPSVNEGN